MNPQFIRPEGILKAPLTVDPVIMEGVDIRAGGKSTFADDFLHLPKEPGSKLGPSKAVMDAEGITGAKAGSGIHDAATISRLNERIEKRQLVDAVLGDDARGWSRARDEMAFRVATDTASPTDLAAYAQDEAMQRVVTRWRQLATEAWEASQGDNPTLRIDGFRENYTSHVNPYDSMSLTQWMEALGEKVMDLDVPTVTKTRLQMRRTGADTAHPFRLTDAVEAYSSAIAKQRNLDPLTRLVQDQINLARKAGPEVMPVDEQTIKTILNYSNHSYQGKATDFEIKLARTPVVREALAGMMFVFDKIGLEVNPNKPLSTLLKAGADVATMAQVSPLRASTSHFLGDAIKKGMAGGFSKVPAQFARGLAKRLKVGLGMDQAAFEQYRDAGIINDFWRMEPTDTRLSLLPRTLRAPFQLIAFVDEAAKMAAYDELYPKFLKQGMEPGVARQRAILATIRQQNFTEALHMPPVFAMPGGQAFGLFNRARLSAANDAVRWLKSKDGITYMRGLGVVGTVALASAVGVDVWQRLHMLPELEAGGITPPALSIARGMVNQARSGRPMSFWWTRMANPKGDTTGQKFLDVLGLRKKSEEELRRLEQMRLRR